MNQWIKRINYQEMLLLRAISNKIEIFVYINELRE